MTIPLEPKDVIKSTKCFFSSISRTNFSRIQDQTTILFCYVLFELTPSQRKEVGIPLGILPHVQEQNKRSWFRVNANTAATRNQTWCLA